MKKLLLALLLSCTTVYAAPVAISEGNGIKVTLFDEPCALTRVVDLPYRATWTEGGKLFEGCYNVVPEAGAVVAYFTDRSIALMPVQIFKPLRSM